MVADLPLARLGLTICYDLRFPTLYRALAEAGATFLAIPSAFTRQTGEAHWHVLDPCPRDRKRRGSFSRPHRAERQNGRETFGHSLAVDPWGRILAEGDTEPGVVIAEIDPAEVTAARGTGCRRCGTASVRDGRAHGRASAAPCGVGVSGDSLCVGLRAKATISKAGSAIPLPMTSRQSAAW